MAADLVSLYAPLPRTVRGRSVVVSGKDDKKTILYVHDSNVYIRNIEDSSVCDVYSEHPKQTTVAKYSPSGFYIASADVSGKLRIWDTVNKEHILKNEFQPFAGPVADLDWSGDNQRLVVGGEGREIFIHAINADTGTSVGDMLGHNKPVNSVAFKSGRPFRIASGAEDRLACFYSGPPFKLTTTIEDHTNFVNSVRYAPDDSKFATGSSDGRVFLYDGKTADKVLEFGSPAHKGGVYGVCFSPDSKEVLTVSGDKTAKIWSAETGDLITEFVMGSGVPDMQLGCLWQGDFLLTVSLSGNINYLDRSNPSTPSTVIMGHSKQINALCMYGDSLYSADSDGKVCVWNTTNGTCVKVGGTGHSAQIQSMSVSGDKATTCSIDDTVKEIDATSQSYNDVSVKMSSQPQCVCTSEDGYTAVACLGEVMLLQNGRLICTTPVPYTPSSVSIHPNQTQIAVGGSQDSSVHVYSIEGGKMCETNVLKQTGAVTCLAYSPDGAYLATGNANRRVMLYSCADYSALITEAWTAHTAKVLCVSWSPDSQHVASGGIDTNVLIWDVNNKNKKIKIDRAHKMSAVSSVAWKNDNEVFSAGHDACIRLWRLSF